MRQAEKTLSLDTPVGQDAPQGGHENGYEPLDGIKIAYILTQPDRGKIVAHGREVRAPSRELEEKQDNETKF